MADEYIRLDTTIIAIDHLINEAATGTMARTLYKAKDTLYSQQRYVIDVQPVKRCRMIPLEPDCRGCTDVFICTNCHQHIHLGFIRKEYSGSYCLECGAEVKDGDT
jgi:hypothetical protein